MTLALGLGLAALSAVASNLGFLLRHRGAVQAPAVDVRRPLRSAIDLFRQKWWTVGYAFAVLAYLLHVGALGLADLSAVQAVLASGLVVLGVLAERFFGLPLARRQWAGVALAAAGLALLALTGEPRSGQDSASYSAAAMIAFEAGLVAVGVALILSHRVRGMRAQRGIMLGLAAGLLFTATHVAVKAASGKVDGAIWDALLSPYLLIALAGGIVAFFASARSLQIGPPVAVIAITSIAGNVSAVSAGIVVFGDSIGGDPLAVVGRSLAFLAVVVAGALIPAPTRAVGLGRAPEPEPPPGAAVPATAALSAQRTGPSAAR